MLVTALGLALATVAPEPWLVRATARLMADGTPSLLEPHHIARLRGLLAVMAATASMVLLLTLLFRRQFTRVMGWFGGGLEELTHGIRADVAALWSDHKVSLVLATVVGAALRLARMGRPIEFDEATTALFYSSRTLLDAVTRYDVPNNHILHSVLAVVSTALFGDGEVALRLPAFTAGVALIPVAAWVGFRLAGGGAALVAAWLVAVWPSLVIYGALARGYSLATLLTLVALGLVAQSSESKETLSACLAGVCLGLAVWTVPVAVLGAVAVGLFFVMKSAWGRGSLPYATILTGVTTVVAVVCYAPIWLVQGWTPLVGNQFVSRGGVGDPWMEWVDFGIELTRINGAPPWALAAVVLLLVVSALARAQTRPTACRLVLAAVGAVVLLSLVPMRPVPARSLTIVTPVILLSLASLLAQVRVRRGVELLVASGLVAASLVVTTMRAPWLWLPDPETPEQLAEAVRAAAAYHEQGHHVIMDSSEALVDPARYYARRVGLAPTDVIPILDPSDIADFSPGSRLLLITYEWDGGERHSRHVRSYLRDAGAAAEARTVDRFGNVVLVSMLAQ